MTKKSIISIILLTVTISLFAQNSTIDSLQKELNRVRGNERILVLNDLAYAYGYIDATKSINLAKEALLLAEEKKYNNAKALTYDILGRAYFISGKNKTADEYYNKCILTAEKYGSENDIYKALRHKTMVYVDGYIRDSNELITVYKKYINMTIEKNNYADFQDGLKSFVYIFQTQQSNSIIISDYFTELRNRTKRNSEFLSSVYAGEAYYFQLNHEYFKAIQHYAKAIELTKDLNTKTSHIERIGNSYFEIRKFKESVLYYCDALKLVNRHETEPKIFIEYLLEADLGASYLQLKNYNTALSYLQKAITNPYFTDRDRGAIYGNMAVAYMSIKSFDQADYFLSKAISIFVKLSAKSEKLACLNTKAELIKCTHQWSQLPLVTNEISKLVNEVDEYYILYDSFEILSNYYEKSGDYKRSNEYLRRLMIVNDSISNSELASKIKEFDYKYETEKKEQQITLQQITIKDKNLLLIISAIAGSLIFALMLLIFVLYRIRNKAYKQLVYKSLGSTNNTKVFVNDGNVYEDDIIEIKNVNSVLDGGLQKKIEFALNKQVDAKIYLESNINLNILSEKCDTNRSYLSQFINDKYKMNFNTFINTLRINEAKHMLSEKDSLIPLKELYIRLGFNTYSVFNEAFKKHVGVTPNFYLKTVKDLFDISKSNK